MTVRVNCMRVQEGKRRQDGEEKKSLAAAKWIPLFWPVP